MSGARASIAIRPSALGGKGLLLFAALEVAFLATNYSNLFFLMLAFCAVLGGLGVLWSWRNLRGVQIVELTLPMAAAGSAREGAVELAVALGARRRRFDLEVAIEGEDGPEPVAWLPTCVGGARATCELPPRPRGVCAVERVRVTSTFPFGLFRARLRVPIELELVTHPAPAPNPTQRTGGAADASDDDGAAQRAGRGLALAGLREFRTGDAVADVHWRASARRGTAVVKERERDHSPTACAVLDRRCDATVLETALEHAAGMVLAARHRAPLRLLSQDCDLLVDPERGGTRAALRWLAQAAPLPDDAPAPPPSAGATRLPRRTREAR